MNKLTRSIYDRKVAGICGGLGKKYNIDSNLIRVMLLLLYPYISPLFLIYIICIFVIPNEN